MMTNNAKRYLIGKIRLAWRWYDQERKECLKADTCVSCHQRRRPLCADHINPVGHFDPAENPYIARMFCGREGLQPLCRSCHAKKTKQEALKRKEARERNKLK